jgi:hypothetical protein
MRRVRHWLSYAQQSFVSKGYPRAEDPERRNNGRAYYRASCVCLSSQRLAFRTARITRSLADIVKFLERLRNAR